MASCLTDSELERFARGKSTPSAAAAAEAHLERCGRCAARLAELPIDAELLTELKDVERVRRERVAVLARLAQEARRATTMIFGVGRKPA
jgi:hypothetical protein